MNKTKEKRIMAKDTNKYPVEINWYGYKIIKKTKNSNWLVIRPDGTCTNHAHVRQDMAEKEVAEEMGKGK